MARSKTPLVVAAVVGVAAIVAVRLFTGGDDPSSGPGDPAASASPTDPSACTPVVVAASSEKAALMTSLAQRFNDDTPVIGDQCYAVTVTSVASGAGEAALARGWDEDQDGPAPDVWSPAASTWVGLLRQDLAANDRPDLVPDETPSIASTPLVLAMPRPMAEALGWPEEPLGWKDVLTLAGEPDGWATIGHPEWGRFTLGKTNPNISTSGLAATVGAFVAATGKSSDLTAADVENRKVRRFVTEVERSVLHYGDTTLTYLANLQRADEAGAGLGYVSAVAVEEKSVLDYNTGNPTGNLATAGDKPAPSVPLAAIYPEEGTLFSDSPYVVLDAPWATAEKREVAAQFLEFLLTEESQKAFTDAGFRSADGEPGEPILESEELIPDGVKIALAPPAPAVLEKVRDAWDQLRKPARVLLLLDESGSMAEPVPAAGTTKLELAKTAALRAMEQLAPTDEVGVWAFTTDLPTPAGIYDELVPVSPLKKQRAEVRDAIRNLIPRNGTPLYAAVRAAVAEMNATFDSQRINAVVVLTDGRNEFPGDTDLDGLLRTLDGGSVEAPLRVFAIAYGDGADLDTLRAISEASNAAAYDATRAESIDKVFTAVLSNF